MGEGGGGKGKELVPGNELSASHTLSSRYPSLTKWLSPLCAAVSVAAY